MATTSNYSDPEVLASLASLELRARHIVEGFTAGRQKSPYHGFSVEFAEHRDYTPGDDPRYVDWKVFGRTERMYLKRFTEETNLECMLLLDTSGSMAYQGASAAMPKLEYGKCLVAALAFMLLRQSDRAGLAIFDRRIRSMVPLSGKGSQRTRLFQALAAAEAGESTACGAVFHEMAERFSRRGMVIVASDLLADPHDILQGLHHLRFQGHEVLVFHLFDPDELKFPFEGPMAFRDLEGTAAIGMESSLIRSAYLEAARNHIELLEKECRRRDVDYVWLTTDRPLEHALLEFLAARQRAFPSTR